jgi:hypothetical protein
VLGQCAPSPQACRHTPSPGSAAGSPRRVFFCRRRQRYKHAQFFCRRRQRHKHGCVVERPPKSYGQRLKLVEGSSPRGLTCHYTDKAGYIYSAPLYICRVVLLLLEQRRGAGLGELQRARSQRKYFAIAPANTQRALHGAQSSRGRSGKTT